MRMKGSIMRERFSQFMRGRYGNDRFNQFLMVVALVFLVLSFLGLDAFYMIALIIMIYAYYRMFSRRIYQRVRENQWYLKKEMKVKGWLTSQKKMLAQQKTHHIYKCPNCKQKIRVPRGRGKIEISCPKCKTRFIKKS